MQAAARRSAASPTVIARPDRCPHAAHGPYRADHQRDRRKTDRKSAQERLQQRSTRQADARQRAPLHPAHPRKHQQQRRREPDPQQRLQAGKADRIAAWRRPSARLHPAVHRDHRHRVEQHQQDRRQPGPRQPAAGGSVRKQGDTGHARLRFGALGARCGNFRSARDRGNRFATKLRKTGARAPVTGSGSLPPRNRNEPRRRLRTSPISPVAHASNPARDEALCERAAGASAGEVSGKSGISESDPVLG